MRNRITCWMGIVALVVLTPSCLTSWALDEPDSPYLTETEREKDKDRRRLFLPFALIGDVLTWPFLLSLDGEEDAGEDDGC